RDHARGVRPRRLDGARPDRRIRHQHPEALKERIMTTMQDSPTAAGSGASASENFKAKQRADAGTPAERVSTIVTAVLQGVHAATKEHGVTYPEFQAAKAWLMEVGEVGEWPLFMDVFVEHVVEEVAADAQRGTKGTIEGPYYLPDQVRLSASCELPHRE